MATFTYLDVLSETATSLDFGDFVSLVKGSSITSLATSDDFVEFGLSDGFNMRIDAGSNVTLMPTTSSGEYPPLRFGLISEDETPTAQLVESRLHALRQIYATNFLVNEGREEELSEALKNQKPSDLELLLAKRDRLLISSASIGSFWVTIVAKTKSAFRSVSDIAPLFFDEGRQAVLERTRAKTELAKLDVEKKRDEINLQRLHGFIDLYKKIDNIKDSRIREMMKEQLLLTGNLPPTLTFEIPVSKSPKTDWKSSSALSTDMRPALPTPKSKITKD